MLKEVAKRMMEKKPKKNGKSVEDAKAKFAEEQAMKMGKIEMDEYPDETESQRRFRLNYEAGEPERERKRMEDWNRNNEMMKHIKGRMQKKMNSMKK